MDYRKIAYGAFYDRKGRVWGITLFRRTDTVMAARELTFEGSEAAVVEWDEFDLAEPIQGSALTLRVISEADREWVSLYTVNDGEVAVEVTLDGELWWRGSLDPETYEEPYERARDYTVTLRFSDFGPLKRHQFVLHGEGLVKTGTTIGANLLEIGTVTALSDNGLPANTDLTAIATPEGMTVADMLGIGASPEAFVEDNDTDDRVKAWEGVSALLTASGLRMTQRAGKIVLFNLKGLRDNASAKAEECVWSGDSQTLSADAISSRVTVCHKGDGEDNLVKELRTGRERDEKALSVSYGYSPHDISYNSFSVTLYKTSTWQRPEKGWGFFTIRGGLDSVQDAEGWMMLAYRNSDYPFSSAIDYPFYASPQSASAGAMIPVSGIASFCACSPKTYIHLTDEEVRNEAFTPRKGYRLRIEQEMLFDCRYNPFATGESDKDWLQSAQDKYAKAQMVYVLAYLTLTTDTGKKYYWTNQEHVFSGFPGLDYALFAPCDSTIGRWSEYGAPYWIQYRPGEKYEEGAVVGAGWTMNKPFVSRPSSIKKWKDLKLNRYTQKLPDGDFIPLPPERGWLTLDVCAAVEFVGDGIDSAEALRSMRWILGKGASISIVDANGNYQTPESSESEIKVVCDNGAEDPLELSPLLGSGGGYLGCRSIIINADGTAADKGEPELRTAAEAASQLCMRRTKLSGEAYINTAASLTFTERLQNGRVFLLSSEIMDLQNGWGDRTLTELLRTDIDGLEVRRNERVIFEGTADRGGRDGRDAESYSIVPTCTAVGSQWATRMAGEGTGAHLERYIRHIPEKVGCSVYLTVGPDTTRTRDGVLRCRTVGLDGETLSELTVANDGGDSEEVTVAERCSALEFRLYDIDPEEEGAEARLMAICTIPVSTDSLILPEYDDGKLNFTDVTGDKLLQEDIAINNHRDLDCGPWEDGRTYYTSYRNLLTGMTETHHVWYMGCKYKCLVNGTTEPPTWDSQAWLFEEGDPELRLEWAGSEDTVYADDPKITLSLRATIYNQDVTEHPRTRWDWRRESYHGTAPNTLEDAAWSDSHQNQGEHELNLVEADMNYHAGQHPDKLVYTATASIRDEQGQVFRTQAYSVEF